MGFSRQEYWSGLPFPFSGHLPNPGIEPRSPVLQADSLPSEPPEKVESKGLYLEPGTMQWEYRVVGGQQTWEGRCQHVEQRGMGVSHPHLTWATFPREVMLGEGEGGGRS